MTSEQYDVRSQLWKHIPRTRAEFQSIHYFCEDCGEDHEPCDRCGDLFEPLKGHTDQEGTALCPGCVKTCKKEA